MRIKLMSADGLEKIIDGDEIKPIIQTPLIFLNDIAREIKGSRPRWRWRKKENRCYGFCGISGDDDGEIALYSELESDTD